jgi:hypothetical protein
LRTPICTFDAMNGILCPQCESKLDSGKLTKTDVEAAIKLAHLSKKIPQIDTDKVISIVKDLRGIELAVEFERQ